MGRSNKRHHAAKIRKPVRQNGLVKEKQARFPVPVTYNLAEKWGFEPQIPLWGILT